MYCTRTVPVIFGNFAEADDCGVFLGQAALGGRDADYYIKSSAVKSYYLKATNVVCRNPMSPIGSHKWRPNCVGHPLRSPARSRCGFFGAGLCHCSGPTLLSPPRPSCLWTFRACSIGSGMKSTSRRRRRSWHPFTKGSHIGVASST